MGQRLPSARETASAHAAAQTTLEDYLAIAGAAPAADVTRAFTGRASRRELLTDGEGASVFALNDPLARAVAVQEASVSENSFARASDGRTAAGLWVVRSASQAPLGHYRAQFRRERDRWLLTRLEIANGASEPKPVTGYCHSPGDVEAFVAAEAERDLRRAERRQARQARRSAARS
jgi:hypothetical protein